MAKSWACDFGAVGPFSYATSCGRTAIARYENKETGIVLWRCDAHDGKTRAEMDPAIYGRQPLTQEK
jgi:hypothetical protein